MKNMAVILAGSICLTLKHIGTHTAHPKVTNETKRVNSR